MVSRVSVLQHQVPTTEVVTHVSVCGLTVDVPSLLRVTQTVGVGPEVPTSGRGKTVLPPQDSKVDVLVQEPSHSILL